MRFEGLLRKASHKTQILILIDGINDLKDLLKFNCLSDWLPCDLPEHVKIIVSMDSENNLCEKYLSKSRYGVCF